jgi:hypothetical protein
VRVAGEGNNFRGSSFSSIELGRIVDAQRTDPVLGENVHDDVTRTRVFSEERETEREKGRLFFSAFFVRDRKQHRLLDSPVDPSRGRSTKSSARAE